MQLSLKQSGGKSLSKNSRLLWDRESLTDYYTHGAQCTQHSHACKPLECGGCTCSGHQHLMCASREHPNTTQAKSGPGVVLSQPNCTVDVAGSCASQCRSTSTTNMLAVNCVHTRGPLRGLARINHRPCVMPASTTAHASFAQGSGRIVLANGVAKHCTGMLLSGWACHAICAVDGIMLTACTSSCVYDPSAAR